MCDQQTNPPPKDNAMYPRMYSWDKQVSFPIAVAKLCKETAVHCSEVSETAEVNQDETWPL